jgi:hypothetical protein
VARPHGLIDEEYEALRALQEAAPAPAPEHVIWDYLVSSGLVWIDEDVLTPTVQLTPAGRRYPTD